MTRLLDLLMISGLVLLSASPLWAEAKFITLKDGSVIRGVPRELYDGYYTIETDLLGVVEIEESRVDSISSNDPGAANASAGQPSGSASPTAGVGFASPQLQAQMMQAQQQMLSDPQMMMELQKMAQDPELMELIADPQFMRDIMSQDPARVENNPKFEKLLKNPAMRRMMNMMQAR